MSQVHFTGWVYFVQADDLDYIKVGWTAVSPDRRFANLEVSSPVKLRPLGVIEAERGLEHELHVRFAPYRVKGEWFVPDESLLEYIECNARPYVDEDAAARLDRRLRRRLERLRPKPAPLPAPPAFKSCDPITSRRNDLWLWLFEVGPPDPRDGSTRRMRTTEIAGAFNVSRRTVQLGIASARSKRFSIYIETTP